MHTVAINDATQQLGMYFLFKQATKQKMSFNSQLLKINARLQHIFRVSLAERKGRDAGYAAKSRFERVLTTIVQPARGLCLGCFSEHHKI